MGVAVFFYSMSVIKIDRFSKISLIDSTEPSGGSSKNGTLVCPIMALEYKIIKFIAQHKSDTYL